MIFNKVLGSPARVAHMATGNKIFWGVISLDAVDVVNLEATGN
jgi:hypothetical protein